jgi:PKD repeat protein
MKKFYLAIAMGLVSFMAKAQEPGLSYCGTTEVRNRVFNDFYQWRIQDSIDRQELSDFTRHYEQSGDASRDRGQIYIIPVVFHIVHMGGVENISDFQVYDAIRILNEDYRKMNSDTTAIVQPFKSIAGDVEIEFRLATKDPSGNCHKGITRTYSANTVDQGINFSGHAIVDDVIDEHGLWPSNKYMNVFVCIDPSGAAGYTYNPGNYPTTINSMYSSIFISHSYVGAIGTGSTQRSRALTHEVGHWLNLDHTWGPNNNPGNAASCADDDDVQDTPMTIGWTSCNLNGNTCDDTNDPNNYSSWTFDQIDNVQNYMEYSYCSRMFTNGQVARMRAAINSTSGGRSNLKTTANLNATGVLTPAPLCAADFEADVTLICAGQSVTFEDRSYHSVIGRTWNFPGGTANSTTDSVVTVTYDTPGNYTVTLTATDGTNSVSETKTAYITVLPLGAKTPPIVEGFEAGAIVAGDWFLTNPTGNAWEITSGAAASGTYSIFVDNETSMAGEKHEIISTTYALQFFQDITVSFKYAYAQRNSATADILRFSVSSNCGQSWSIRKTLTGSGMSTAGMTGIQWYPNASQWEEELVTTITPIYLTPEFRMKFEFESDGGNNLFLDDINIFGTLGVIHLDDDYLNLAIYPNPTNGEGVRVDFNLNATSEYTLVLVDQLGQEVMNIASSSGAYGVQSHVIQPGSLAAGMYFVRLQAGDKVITERVVIR